MPFVALHMCVIFYACYLFSPQTLKLIGCGACWGGIEGHLWLNTLPEYYPVSVIMYSHVQMLAPPPQYAVMSNSLGVPCKCTCFVDFLFVESSSFTENTVLHMYYL